MASYEIKGRLEYLCRDWYLVLVTVVPVPIAGGKAMTRLARAMSRVEGTEQLAALIEAAKDELRNRGDSVYAVDIDIDDPREDARRAASG